MKKLLFLSCFSIFILVSCGDKKKDDLKKDSQSTKDEIKNESVSTPETKAAQIALGEKLFADNTCVTCHAVNTKIIGPSLQDMMKIYDEKGGNLVQFMKGNADPIVDTDVGQVAIMKASLDGILKNLPPEELQALAAYMRSVAK